VAELVANCPRCGSHQITFDVTASKSISFEYNWKRTYEVFGVCRNCSRCTIFVLSDNVNANYDYVHKTGLLKVEGALNKYVDVLGHISQKDTALVAPPSFLPKDIEAVYREGAMCLATGCNNAAGTMFRLCVDLATKSMLPSEETAGLTTKIRRDLGLRLPWLFDSGRLPETLKELSSCIKEDGNDGAHRGSLSESEAGDLLDFCTVLLERLYTEPERLRLAKERRDSRRSQNQ
jgi:hypothetical protein